MDNSKKDKYSHRIRWKFLKNPLTGWIDPSRWKEWVSTSLTCLRTKQKRGSQPKRDIGIDLDGKEKSSQAVSSSKSLSKGGLDVCWSFPNVVMFTPDGGSRSSIQKKYIKQARMFHRQQIPKKSSEKHLRGDGPPLKNFSRTSQRREDRLAGIWKTNFGGREAKKWLFYTGPF